MGEPRAQHTLSSSAADVAFSEERSPEAGILDAMIGVQEIQKKLQNGQNGFPKVTEKGSRPVICINSGGDCLSRASGTYDFSADAFFTGGEVIRADDRFGEEEGPSVYQTATSGEGSTNIGLPLQTHTKDNCEQCTCNAQKQVSKFKEEFERLQKEQEENNRTLERLKKENEFKDRECQKARMPLQELHNELMRKSMHVGSLGQVKEKSLWFSCLQDISKKFKVAELVKFMDIISSLFYSICCMRKSIQMKMKLKSPLYHHKEMDKARVSVGGKLRLAQRVLVSDLRGPKFVQQRQQKKVKERGWNRRASMKNLTG